MAGRSAAHSLGRGRVAGRRQPCVRETGGPDTTARGSVRPLSSDSIVSYHLSGGHQHRCPIALYGLGSDLLRSSVEAMPKCNPGY